MIAIIDIGNSAVKISSVDQSGLPGMGVTTAVDSIDGVLSAEPLQDATRVIIACSGDEAFAAEITDRLQKKGGVEVLPLDPAGPVPFASAYATGQAGIDRLANVTAAINEFGFPAIIVDAGSAITLEVVDSNCVFLGGAILPGFRLQAEALHRGTAKLPDISIDAATPIIGNDTTLAIRSGILYGCLGAVSRLLRLTLDEPGITNPFLLFTGGDAPLITDSLDVPDAVTVPDLTLRGLYLLAKHQYPGQLPNSH